MGEVLSQLQSADREALVQDANVLREAAATLQEQLHHQVWVSTCTVLVLVTENTESQLNNTCAPVHLYIYMYMYIYT